MIRTTAILLAATAVIACQITIERYPRPDTQDDVRDMGFLVEGSVIDPQLLVLGARVFDERCSPCHGTTGRGDGPLANLLPIKPRNYHGEPFKWGTKPSDIATTIALGRSQVMPPFKGAISPNEMWATAYLVWHWLPEARRTRDTAETLANWKVP